MQPKLIISAIIRLVSLKYFLAALSYCSSLPAHISMLADSMSEVVQSSGRSGLVSDAVNIGFNLMLGLLLWIFAAGIAGFILRTFEKKNKV